MLSSKLFGPVMEYAYCGFVCKNKSGNSASRFIRSDGKLPRAVYAGLIIVCFVPSVLCQGWSRRLTFDAIYNETNYVQLQQSSRPFTADLSPHTFTTDLSEHRFRTDSNSHPYSTDLSSHPYSTDSKYHPYSKDLSSHSYSTDLSGHPSNTDLSGHPYSTDLSSHPYSTDLSVHPFTSDLSPHPFTDLSQIPTEQDYNQRINLEEYGGNEIEIDYDVTQSSVVKVPLLVGFSHDPFRYSVPEDDYLKGVRNMNPKSIMSKGENRGKRGVLHLYNMMYCATGCEPLSYKGYGCYCGFLGSGRPTDGIDRCCKIHDECYENIYCPFFTVYFQPYYWKCYKGKPLCALENYHTEHQFINGCAARLCECDRKFAMCVKKYPCPRRRALCKSSPIRLLQNLLMFR